MRKIRDFNMRLPFKEIRRRVLRGSPAPAGHDDARLLALLQRAEKALKPSVLFDSFGPDSPETASLAPIPGVAHTLAVTTLGPAFAPALDELRTDAPSYQKALEAAAAVAGERSVQFVLSLIKDDVEDERCDLSPIQYLDDPEALSRVLAKLDGAKIGVSQEAGALAPSFSRAFCVSWIARKGRRGA
ncbi:MAG: hypothetical protein KGL53_08810, partial [Elusimicrobia bacterium]|nr:hypothetical protein [Elusimicrobiota bacterium]